MQLFVGYTEQGNLPEWSGLLGHSAGTCFGTLGWGSSGRVGGSREMSWLWSQSGKGRTSRFTWQRTPLQHSLHIASGTAAHSFCRIWHVTQSTSDSSLKGSVLPCFLRSLNPCTCFPLCGHWLALLNILTREHEAADQPPWTVPQYRAANPQTACFDVMAASGF